MGYTLDQGMSENDIKTTLISEEEKFVRSVPAPAARCSAALPREAGCSAAPLRCQLRLPPPLTAGSAVADLRPVRLHRDPRRALGRRGR